MPVTYCTEIGGLTGDGTAHTVPEADEVHQLLSWRVFEVSMDDTIPLAPPVILDFVKPFTYVLESLAALKPFIRAATCSR